jgi:hypothetical protein
MLLSICNVDLMQIVDGREQQVNEAIARGAADGWSKQFDCATFHPIDNHPVDGDIATPKAGFSISKTERKPLSRFRIGIHSMRDSTRRNPHLFPATGTLDTGMKCKSFNFRWSHGDT